MYDICIVSEHIHKRHNKSLLLYHLVCPIKYRRSVLSEDVEKSLVEVCANIETRFEIHFLEIGADDNHVHFLMQSIPMMSPKSIVQVVKSITARELFRLHQAFCSSQCNIKCTTAPLFFYSSNPLNNSGKQQAVNYFLCGGSQHCQ